MVDIIKIDRLAVETIMHVFSMILKPEDGIVEKNNRNRYP